MRVQAIPSALAFSGAVQFGSSPALAHEAALTAQLQQLIEGYVRDRASIEGLGAALQVDRGAGHPIISVFAGNDGLPTPSRSTPIRSSRSAATPRRSTAALILKLEAAGKLRLDDTIGRWLPQYPAGKDVPISSLLEYDEPNPQLFGDGRRSGRSRSPTFITSSATRI